MPIASKASVRSTFKILLLLASTVFVGCSNETDLFGLCTEALQPVRSIKGGTVAVPGQYPNVGGIYWSQADGKGGVSADDFVCTGSLIGEGLILTAAHCVFLDGKTRVNPAELTFTLSNRGDPDLSSSMVKVISLIPHPDYEISSNRGPDLAVMKLAQPLIGNCSFAPVIERELKSGEIAVAVGLGLDVGTSFGTKKIAELVFTSYKSLVYPNGHTLAKGSLYLANRVIATSTCAGDSGSPLLTQDGQLAGVLSSGAYLFGSSCLSSISSIYTAVPPFLDWIKSALREL